MDKRPMSMPMHCANPTRVQQPEWVLSTGAGADFHPQVASAPGTVKTQQEKCQSQEAITKPWITAAWSTMVYTLEPQTEEVTGHGMPMTLLHLVLEVVIKSWGPRFSLIGLSLRE